MLDHPPTRGKTLRKLKKDNHADRVRDDIASTMAAPTTPRLLSSAGYADRLPSSTKAEVALWRAFLGDEIDAILRDKD
jgi:hypothetical protein